jgi:hypothetical protein
MPGCGWGDLNSHGLALSSEATSLDSPEVCRRARAHTGPTARLYSPGVPSPWVRDRLALVRRASLARTGKLAHDRSLGSLYSRHGTPKGPRISATPSMHGGKATQRPRNASIICGGHCAESMPGCGWGDSDSHGLAPNPLRRRCVYQFRHTRPVFWHLVVPVAATRYCNALCRWRGQGGAGVGRATALVRAAWGGATQLSPLTPLNP